jgi:hypothetical protein
MSKVIRCPQFWGGGPSSEQKQAAAAQAQLSAEELQIGRERNAREAEQYAAIKPFAMQRINNGLPYAGDLLDYEGGTNAQAYMPARARLLRVLSESGDMPSGSRISALSNFENDRAHSFDNGIIDVLNANENSKAEAARLLTQQQQIANPYQWYGGSSGANNSIMQAPLQSQGIGSALLGAVGTIGGAAASKMKV